MNSGASAIEVEELTKTFGSLVVVDHLSFQADNGEVFGIVGPNGAGKTTTIRILACLISSSSGSARVRGYDIAKESLQVRQVVGVLTENPSLYERLTAYENLNFFAEAYGVTSLQKRREVIKELLEFFDLWDRRNDKVANFSKGMKQKLAIARALVHDPPVLFLDEPTSGLDPEASKSIKDLIQKLSKEEKHTVLLSTHRLEDAERLCQRVMIIKNGRGIALGTPDELGERIAGRPVLEVRLKELDQKLIDAVKEFGEVVVAEVKGSAARLVMAVDGTDSTTPAVVRSIVYAGGKVLSVNVMRPSLEEAYLKLIEGEAS